MNERVNIKKVAEGESIEALISEQRYGDQRYFIHEKLVLDNKARIAGSFIERWAMVAAEVDGEDSAGRQKMRRLTPGELVKHACDTVELLFSEMTARGWTLSVPGYEEIARALEPPKTE